MKTRKLIEVVGIIAVLVVAISLIFVEVRVYGTGFNGYTIITTSKTTSGASPSTITSTTQSQPGKTLWDWLQLLIIPIVLTIGGFWLNQIQKGREQRIIEQRDKTEREIALDNQREVALQAYIDNMSELLLEKKLRESKPEDEVRKIARVRTLTVLPRLPVVCGLGISARFKLAR